MSNNKQNQNQNQNHTQETLSTTTVTETTAATTGSNREYIAPETLAFDAWVNDTGGGDYMRLPQNDGGTIVAKFSKDKSKRRLVRKTFEDKKTGQRNESIKAEYLVIDPNNALDQKEKRLEVPKTVAYQIEKNLERNHLIQEITRKGTGLSTRYTVVAA